jgi:hypothetical protein
MKKISVLTVLLCAGLTANAFAAQIDKGQETSCNNANTITIEVGKIATTADALGFTTNDRGTGSVNVWKSSNFTTVPITLGPNDSNMSMNTEDHGKTGVPAMGGMGHNKVVLTRQPEFSRGDSIGDISGIVRITNTGTNPVTVTCN